MPVRARLSADSLLGSFSCDFNRGCAVFFDSNQFCQSLHACCHDQLIQQFHLLPTANAWPKGRVDYEYCFSCRQSNSFGSIQLPQSLCVV